MKRKHRVQKRRINEPWSVVIAPPNLRVVAWDRGPVPSYWRGTPEAWADSIFAVPRLGVMSSIAWERDARRRHGVTTALPMPYILTDDDDHALAPEINFANLRIKALLWDGEEGAQFERLLQQYNVPAVAQSSPGPRGGADGPPDVAGLSALRHELMYDIEQVGGAVEELLRIARGVVLAGLCCYEGEEADPELVRWPLVERLLGNNGTPEEMVHGQRLGYEEDSAPSAEEDVSAEEEGGYQAEGDHSRHVDGGNEQDTDHDMVDWWREIVLELSDTSRLSAWLGFEAHDLPEIIRGGLQAIQERVRPLLDRAARGYIRLAVVEHLLRYVRLGKEVEYDGTPIILPRVPGQNADHDVEELRAEVRILNHEVAARNKALVKIRRARANPYEITKEGLMELIDECRFKSNDTVNCTKLGKLLGVNRDTAKQKVIDFGLREYAGLKTKA